LFLTVGLRVSFSLLFLLLVVLLCCPLVILVEFGLAVTHVVARFPAVFGIRGSDPFDSVEEACGPVRVADNFLDLVFLVLGEGALQSSQ
jgi:hypothetical protein